MGLRALLLVAANIFGVGGVTRRTGKTSTIGDGGKINNRRENGHAFKVNRLKFVMIEVSMFWHLCSSSVDL